MDSKTTAIIAILVVAILGIGAFAVMSGNSNDTETDNGNDNENDNGEVNDHYPVTVKTYDDNKEIRDMTFTEKPTRVFVTWSTTIEMMIHFGLEEYIVGCLADPNDVLGMEEHYDAYKKLNFIGETPDMELVRSLHPDFILGWASSFVDGGDSSIGSHAYWNGLGVKTYVFNSPQNVMDDYYTHIADIGKIFDIEDKTDAYIEKLKNDCKTIQDQTKNLNDDQRKTFLTIMYGDNGPICVFGDETIAGGLGVLGGGVNLQKGKPNWNPNIEDIRGMNPDFIFLQLGDFSHFESHQAAIDHFKNLPGMSGLTSQFMVFEFNQIYPAGIIDPNVFTDMYKAMYP